MKQSERKEMLGLSTIEYRAFKAFEDNLLYFVGGLENALNDGDITKEEAQEEAQANKLVERTSEMLQAAYKMGYLENEKTGELIEAKHLKFIGNEKLEEIKIISITRALKVVIHF